MKILEINTSSFSRLGITMHLLNYYNHIDPQEVQADFIANGKVDDTIVKEFEGLGFHVYKVANRDKNIRAYTSTLYKIMLYGKYDIVRVHGSSAKMGIEMMVARRAKIAVRILHSHSTMTNHPFIHKVLRPLMCAAGNTYFACGEAAGKFLFGERSFDIIPNGIDTDLYRFNEKIRNKVRAKLDFDGKIVVGHIGNIMPVKNHPFMLKIIKELVKINPAYLLVCVGWGDYFELEKACIESQIEDNVMFLGKRNDVREIIQGFDVMILPSFNEGLPIVAVEGQAAGLPFVISDTVTHEVAFTEDVKYLSINNNEIEWANQIEYLIQNVQRNRTDGYNVVKRNGYDIKDNAKELVRKFRELIEGELY